jgi:hypothetical protein
MELDQLTDWLWCLRTDFVHAYAVREGDGFCLIDTSTAGNEEAILGLLGDLAGPLGRRARSSRSSWRTGIATTPDPRPRSWPGPARASSPRSVTRRSSGAEQSAPPPQLTDWEVPLFEQVMPGVPLEQRLAPAAAVVLDRLVRDGETFDWQRRATLFAVPATPHNGRPILGVFNSDPAAARDSFRRLASLDADLACFGHGDPIRSRAGLRLPEVARSL